MISECWKLIENFPNYEVSDIGNIRRFCKGIYRTVKTRKNRYGYIIVDLYKNGKRTTALVHRCVAKSFIPQTRNNANTVHHIDENKCNNSVYNLSWVTVKENNTHNGLSKRRGFSVHKAYQKKKIIRKLLTPSLCTLDPYPILIYYL